MKLKRFIPTSNGLRQRVLVKNTILWKGSSIKQLVKGKRGINGRNHSGKTTIYFRGGGHKRKLRILNNNIGVYNSFSFLRLEYDPNRSGYIVLCKSKSGKLFYSLAADNIQFSKEISGSLSLKESKFISGSTLRLSEIPVGTSVYNVENNHYSQIARAAGVSCEILKVSDSCVLRLPSKKIITLSADNLATIGRVSNILHNNQIKGKAGANRWIGRKPVVRAVAKNPIDHPHGGKTKVSGGLGGAHKTRWGKLAKWNKK
jgi:large subunit ribosomal protein L2